jgi:hypothetical protein
VANLFDIITRNQRKPRGFNYKPMYYNAEKAAFNDYVEKLRAERDAKEKGEYRPDFKGKFSSQVGRKTNNQKKIAVYNIRLFIILIVIGFMAYHLFNTNAFNDFVNQFFNVFSKKDGLY